MKSLWIAATLITSVIIGSSLEATLILDEVMSKEEQKKTGIHQLSRQQKIAFEKWLNQTFVLKTEAEKSEFSPLSLAINIHGGHRLQLSDNSVWEIDPADVKIASGWITPIPIKIGSSKSSNYPYLIINAHSGVSVKARQAQQQTQKPTPLPQTAPKEPSSPTSPAASEPTKKYP